MGRTGEKITHTHTHTQDADTFNSDSMDHNERILAVIADLDSQGVPNYGATAKNYDLVRTTLWRRHTSQTVSRGEATTEFRQALNEDQGKSSPWPYWGLSG